MKKHTLIQVIFLTLFSFQVAHADILSLSAGVGNLTASGKSLDTKEAQDTGVMLSFSHKLVKSLSAQLTAAIPVRTSFQGIALGVGYDLLEWPESLKNISSSTDNIRSTQTPVWTLQASASGGRWRYFDKFSQPAAGGRTRIQTLAQFDLYGYLLRGSLGRFVSKSVHVSLEAFQLGAFSASNDMSVNQMGALVGMGWWYE